MLVEKPVELRHHLTGDLVETGADDTQVILRTVDLKIIEERSLERGVVGTAGIDEQTVGLRALTDGPHQRRHLDEVRPCTGENTDILCHNSLIFVQRYVFFFNYLVYFKKKCNFANEIPKKSCI